MEMDCRGNSLYYARCKKYHNPLLYIEKSNILLYKGIEYEESN